MRDIIEEEEEERKIKEEEIKEEKSGDTDLLSDDNQPLRKKVKVSLLLI